ncbi:MAG: PAS domain S-box protein [Rhodocyclaceae bacterium]|nr:PAS domain S-box protein [Rhodocyclaceae bacterium]
MNAQTPPPLAVLEALCDHIADTRHVLVVRMEDGHIVYANPVICAALAYPADALAGMTLESLHDEFELDFIERRHQLTRGLIDDGELRLRRSDGSDLWLRFYGVPIPPVNGQPCRLLVGRDIMRFVERRIEDEGRMAALYRGQAIAEYDTQGRLLDANELFLGLMGGTLEELRGTGHRDLADVGFVSSDAYDRWWARICLGEVDEGERRYVDASGRELWLREVFNPIFGLDGRPFRILQAALDVTAARLAQQRLRESINYASHIQRALHQPSRRVLQQVLPDTHALLWEPRDVVGGDCLFAREQDGGLWFCLFDCTGHGAPGALLASIVLAETDRILGGGSALSPGEVLGHLNRRVKQSLGQMDAGDGTGSDDGLDAVVIRLEMVSAAAQVASSGLPVFVVEPGLETVILRGDSGGLGYRRVPADRRWETRTLTLGEGMRLFVATDGIFDQPGGLTRVGYGRRRFAASLTAHAELPAAAQLAAVMRDFAEYQGTQSRRDDVAIAVLQLPER